MLMSEAKIEFPEVDGNLQPSCLRLRMQRFVRKLLLRFSDDATLRGDRDLPSVRFCANCDIDPAKIRTKYRQAT